MVQLLRAILFLHRTSSWLQAPILWFTTAYNFSSRGTDTLLKAPQAPALVNICTYTHNLKIKINLKQSNKTAQMKTTVVT